MDEVRLALMTAPTQEVAQRLVETLVQERLVACGNIVPGLTSIYRWKGELERDAEVLVILKTGAAQVPRLLQRAPELHPYEVPELLVVPVREGHPPYLAWIESCLASTEESGE